jgi:hypothetical protein
MPEKRNPVSLLELITPLSLPALILLQVLVIPSSEAQGSNLSPSPKEPRQALPLHGSPAKETTRPPVAAQRAGFPVGELDALSDIAEEIFELAQANKTERIPKKLEMLKKYAAAVSYLQDESNTTLLPRLGHTLIDLEQAVATKNRLETMRYANRVTLIAATLAVPYRPSIPTELSLLDYNGRELGLSSESKKTEKLANIVMRMHLAWQTLMPKLVERNAIKELRRFSEIMGRLESAKTADEYSHLSRLVGIEMDVMKGVFARQYR